MKTSPDNTQVDVPFSERDIRLIQEKIGVCQKRCIYYFFMGTGIGILYILLGRIITVYEPIKILVVGIQLVFFSFAAFGYWRGKRLTKDLHANKKWMLLTVLKEKRHFVGRHKVELVLQETPRGLEKLFIPLMDEYLWEEGDLLSLAYLPASGFILHYENLRSTVKI